MKIRIAHQNDPDLHSNFTISPILTQFVVDFMLSIDVRNALRDSTGRPDTGDSVYFGSCHVSRAASGHGGSYRSAGFIVWNDFNSDVQQHQRLFLSS